MGMKRLTMTNGDVRDATLCPSCGEHVPASEYDEHLDACAGGSDGD